MGYYTNYALEVHEGNFEGEPEEVLDAIHKDREDHSQFGFFGDAIKWYEHDEDMKEFSKMYPDVVFALKGEGVENGDLWVKYYKNGLFQECPAEITYGEYDETKLR